MRHILELGGLLIALALLHGCQTPGTSAVPVSTQGAQNVGQDQGSAQTTEAGSASNRNQPFVMNILAAKTVKIGMTDGVPTTVEVAGADDAQVTVHGHVGDITYDGNEHDSSQQAEVQSGQGAAGGTGGVAGGPASREASGSAAGAGNQPAPVGGAGN